jgi:ferredoxin
MKLVVDPIKCTGHGMCAELFPEGVELDDWGYPIVRELPDDPELAGGPSRPARRSR